MYVIFVLAGVLFVGGCQSDKSASNAEPSHTNTSLTPRVDAKTTADNVAQISQPLQRQPGEFLDFVPPQRLPLELTLVSVPVTAGPTIDGHAGEPIWETAPAITTLDFSSQRPIILKSVYTTNEVFFLVTYPDDAPSETHKTWVWDVKEEIYREGPDREDVFLFKWSMSGNDVSLALRDGAPHRGDIWFWKAKRTNPSGYADDKWQSLSLKSEANAMRITSPKYGVLYFRRRGDAGQEAFEERNFYAYQGDMLSHYYPTQPQGSRADVRAKGVWHNGQWTIEFARRLDTGHDDDLAFTPGGVYLFGVACYEMSYGTPHPEWSQPLYRTGDTFDRLFFTLARRESK
jgi:hypothetical protein